MAHARTRSSGDQQKGSSLRGDWIVRAGDAFANLDFFWGGAEGEGERIPSRLRAVNAELDAVLDPRNSEIMT